MPGIPTNNHVVNNEAPSSIPNPTLLPTPGDMKSKQYSKSKAIDILSHTKKVTRSRTDMMNAMIESGYAPTNIRNLQRLMKMKADVIVIVNNEWTSGTLNNKKLIVKLFRSCDGIQSLILDKSAMEKSSTALSRLIQELKL